MPPIDPRSTTPTSAVRSWMPAATSRPSDASGLHRSAPATTASLNATGARLSAYDATAAVSRASAEAAQVPSARSAPTADGTARTEEYQAELQSLRTRSHAG